MSETQRTFQPLQIAIITLSSHRSLADDSCGALLQQWVQNDGHVCYQRHVLKHQLYALRALVATLIADPQCQAILLNGGTGFAKDNCTVAAIEVLLDQKIAGFGELFRQLSFAQIGSAALQSNAIAGLANHTLIVAMPGSPDAAELAMSQLVLPQLDATQRPCNFVPHLVGRTCDFEPSPAVSQLHASTMHLPED